MESVFGIRLRKLRYERNLKIQEFVDLYNVKYTENKLSKSIVSRYENGIHLPKRFQIVSNIAQFFDVDTDYLMGRSKERKQTSKPHTQLNKFLTEIPILESINATGFNYGNNPVIDVKEVPNTNFGKQFYYKAADNCMMNSGIVKNSYVLFNEDFNPKSGDIIAICDRSRTIQIRRYILRDKLVALLTDCSGIDPILIHKEDVEAGNIRILGKAVKIITKL